MKKPLLVSFAIFFLVIFAAISINFFTSDTSNESHTKAYIAKEQPVFRHNNKISVIDKNDQAINKIVLVGDAGYADMSPGQEHLAALTRRLRLTPQRETVVFLGDNIYQKGYQSEEANCDSQAQSIRRLKAIVDVGSSSSSPSYILPGNHDWDYREKPDPLLLQKQKTFIEKCGKLATYVPSDTEGLKLVSFVRNNLYAMIFLDTQAIISGSEAVKKSALKEIEQIINDTKSNTAIFIAAHHPIATTGPHGGCYQNDYVGSSIINAFRERGISFGQDINEDIYADYIKRISALVPKQRKSVFIAGHDHSLQVLKLDTGPDYSLVSGSGSKTSRTCHGDLTLFAQEALGFMEVSFLQSGAIVLDVFTFDQKSEIFQKAYNLRLF